MELILVSIGGLCHRKVIERQPQRVLLGRANSVTTVASLNECIQRCFMISEENFLNCKSLTYFHEVSDIFKFIFK